MFERILTRCGGIFLVLLDGPHVWIQSAGKDQLPLALPAIEQVLIPPVPDRLPTEVRQGLTTRYHQLGSINRPIVIRGEITNVDRLGDVLDQGFRKLRDHPAQHIVRPIVIASIPGSYPARKRSLLDAAERAGARRVYLVDPLMAAAMGAGLDVVNLNAKGLLLVEADFTEFGVLGYADVLCQHSLPWGNLDLDGPEDPLLLKMTQHILTTLDALRPAQQQAFFSQGVTLIGSGIAIPWIASALSEALGCGITPYRSEQPPGLAGLAGLAFFAEKIHIWSEIMEMPSRP